MIRKVLISPSFGAGWSTWNTDFREDFLFDAEVIAAVEAGAPLGDEDEEGTVLHGFVQRLVAKHGEGAQHSGYFCSASDGLEVVEVDGPFIVEEYDGSESVRLRDETEWI